MSELQRGIKEESEHADVYKAFRAGKIKSAKDMYEMIARAHLKNDPNYYSKLAAIEKKPIHVEGCRHTGKYILVEC